MNDSAGIRTGIIFTNGTGRVVKQKWLKPAHGEVSASSDWNTLRTQAQVPADATCAQWFLGIDGIYGTVDFANVTMNQIRCVQPSSGH